MLQILWRWNLETTNAHIMAEIPVCANILIKFCKRLRQCCYNFWQANPLRLGGIGIVCQIDESLFRYKPKYHRKRAPENEIWIFGIVDTSFSPGRGYIQVVESRAARVLLPIVHSVLRNGSIVHSDEWAAYRGLQESGFVHSTVNHKLNFINPQTGVHTQNAESFWGKIKYRVKIKKGIVGSELKSYCNEWMWRENVGFGKFINLIELCKIYWY
jgi:transposase-like protein